MAKPAWQTAQIVAMKRARKPAKGGLSWRALADGLNIDRAHLKRLAARLGIVPQLRTAKHYQPLNPAQCAAIAAALGAERAQRAARRLQREATAETVRRDSSADG